MISSSLVGLQWSAKGDVNGAEVGFVPSADELLIFSTVGVAPFEVVELLGKRFLDGGGEPPSASRLGSIAPPFIRASERINDGKSCIQKKIT